MKSRPIGIRDLPKTPRVSITADMYARLYQYFLEKKIDFKQFPVSTRQPPFSDGATPKQIRAATSAGFIVTYARNPTKYCNRPTLEGWRTSQFLDQPRNIPLWEGQMSPGVRRGLCQSGIEGWIPHQIILEDLFLAYGTGLVSPPSPDNSFEPYHGQLLRDLLDNYIYVFIAGPKTLPSKVFWETVVVIMNRVERERTLTQLNQTSGNMRPDSRQSRK